MNVVRVVTEGDREGKRGSARDEDGRPMLAYPNGQRVRSFPNGDVWTAYRPPHPTRSAPLIRYEADLPISKGFKLSDFAPVASKPYRFLRVAPCLVKTLESISATIGAPVSVASGYLPASRIGAAGCDCATHADGVAADIWCDGLSSDRLYAVCDAVVGYRGGVGLNASGRVHIDLRGTKVRWGEAMLPSSCATSIDLEVAPQKTETALPAELVPSEEHPCWHGPILGLEYGQGKYTDHLPYGTGASGYPLRVGIVASLEGFSLHQFGRASLTGQKARGLALNGFYQTSDKARELLPKFLGLLADRLCDN
jgi:Peptidase M15